MLSDIIKNETKALHDELESLPLMKVLVSEGMLSLERYADILTRFYRLIFPIEKSMLALSIPDDTYVFSYQPLISDLTGLNVCVENIKEASGLIDINTASRYVGARYLLEGAKHGARVISKNLQKNYVKYPQSYFYSSRNLSHHAWQKFKESIDENNSLSSREVVRTVICLYTAFIQQFKV